MKYRESKCKEILNGLAKTAEQAKKEKQAIYMNEYLKKQEEENREMEKKRRTENAEMRKSLEKEERAGKIKKRAFLTKVIHQSIVAGLLDIANEAYKKQLSSDSKQIYTSVWEKWTHAFIEGEDIGPAGVTAYVTQSKGEWGDKDLGNIMRDSEIEKHDVIDYIFNKGVWHPKLLIETARTAAEANADTENPFVTSKKDEDLISPESNQFTDYYEKFISRQEAPAKPALALSESTPFARIPIKIVIQGKKFSMKSHIAKYLANAINANICNPKKEIRGIIKGMELQEKKQKEEKKAEEKKVEAKKGEGKAAKKEAAQKEAAEPEFDPKLKDIACQIRKLIPQQTPASQKEISELEISFVLHWLSLRYTESPEEAKEKFRETVKRKKEIEKELGELATPEEGKKGAAKGGSAKREQELKTELEELNKQEEKSIIFVGFPSSLYQAQKFQSLAYGCDAAMDDNTLYEKETEERKYARILAKQSLSLKKATPKMPSCFDCFIMIDLSKSDARERGSNLYVDPETKEKFYMNYSQGPPLEEEKKKKLQKVDLAKETLDAIFWRSAATDLEWTKVEDFYMRFPPIEIPALEESGGQKLQPYRKLSGNQPLQEIYKQLDEYAGQWTLYYKTRIQKEIDEILEEFNKEPMEDAEPKHEEKASKGEKEEAKKNEAKKEGEAKKNEAKKEGEEKKNEAKKEGEVKKEEEMKKEVVKKEETKKETPPDDSLKELYQKITEKYLDGIKIIFKFYRKQKSVLMTGLTEMHKQFLSFLERQDSKQKLLDQFMDKLHGVYSDHPEFSRDSTALKEILERVDELSYSIWKVLEKKKDEARAEKEEKMNSQWIQNEISNSVTAGHDLMQYEINHYIDLSYFYICCSFAEAGRPLPRAFDEFVLPLDGSPDKYREDPYSLLERTYQETASFVAKSNYLGSITEIEPRLLPNLEKAISIERTITLKRLESSTFELLVFEAETP